MLSYCLKCRKNTENKHPKVVKVKKEKLCFHQNVQCVEVKRSRFVKNKKQKGY